MKWFVGLGNPGRKYESTRHNIGFLALDCLAQRWDIAYKQSKCHGLLGEGNINGTRVYLLKPMTYMNLSGQSVRAFIDFFKAPLDQMVVIYDDLDTEFGGIRLRLQGSSGGHNGIRSIIEHTGTQTFNRIRLGISRPAPGNDIADYVLSSFSKEERKQLPDVNNMAADAMEYSLDHTFEQTMAKFNR